MQLYQHFYEQSCEFTSDGVHEVTRENMSAVKVRENPWPCCRVRVLCVRLRDSGVQVLAERLLRDPENGFNKLCALPAQHTRHMRSRSRFAGTKTGDGRWK